MKTPRASDEWLCPSAPPEAEGARVIGVVAGSAGGPRVVPLEAPLAVTPELLERVEPVDPGRVLRIAAPCAEHRCKHFQNDACSLASKIVRMVHALEQPLPFCSIRAECRWFGQEGPAACRRCPQVVTRHAQPTPELAMAADPDHQVT